MGILLLQYKIQKWHKEEEIDNYLQRLFHKGRIVDYGLYLVKESIQRINGEFTFIVGKGTTITIEIPKGRDERQI